MKVESGLVFNSLEKGASCVRGSSRRGGKGSLAQLSFWEQTMAMPLAGKQLCGSEHDRSDGLCGDALLIFAGRVTKEKEKEAADGHRHGSTSYSSSEYQVSR